jgi:hypothetical protein
VGDVAAVLFSIGEPSRDRARESVARQTLPVAEVVDVENVSPFSRAMNDGARRVTAPFFVQVDADMILDPGCVEALRGSVQPDTGIVVGELRDELVGRVVGVKLFRTECFRHASFPDSISSDTDFVESIARRGWRTVYFGREEPGGTTPPPTLGDHRPDYTPAYTYRKHMLEGRRYWHRGAPYGLRSRIALLEASPHPLARLAQLALAHGLFLETDADELKPAGEEPRADWLHALLASDTRRDAAVEGLLPLDRDSRLREVFREFSRAGREVAAAGAGATVTSTLTRLVAEGNDPHALVAKVAFGHALLGEGLDPARAAADEQLLARLVTLEVGRWQGMAQVAAARVRQAVQRVSTRRGSARW